MLSIIFIVILGVDLGVIGFVLRKYPTEERTKKASGYLSAIVELSPSVGVIVFGILFGCVLYGETVERMTHAFLVFVLWMYATRFYCYILAHYKSKRIVPICAISMVFATALAILLTPLNRYKALLYSYADQYSVVLGAALFILFYAVPSNKFGREPSAMAYVIRIIAATSFAATVTMTALYFQSGGGVYLTLAITFGTVFYHFGMRLVIGGIFDLAMRNKADYNKKWFHVHAWEYKLFEFLRVGKWKGKLPTYSPDLFSPQLHTLDEIAQAMCVAEFVHETIIVASFLPIVATVWFGVWYVFFATSLCAALFDSVFVIAQRYNRPRIVRLAEKQKEHFARLAAEEHGRDGGDGAQ